MAIKGLTACEILRSIIKVIKNFFNVCIEIWTEANSYHIPRTKKRRGEAAKLAHLLESASLKIKYTIKHYEKICIEKLDIFPTLSDP